MAVSRYNEMTQFLQSISNNDDENSGTSMLTITFRAFGQIENEKQISMPLVPETEKLEKYNVNMHDCPTSAFKMPKKYSEWFSACFGYEVLLVYLGDNKRGVLFEDMLLPKAS